MERSAIRGENFQAPMMRQRPPRTPIKSGAGFHPVYKTSSMRATSPMEINVIYAGEVI
jgi:hypothetical protein